METKTIVIIGACALGAAAAVYFITREKPISVAPVTPALPETQASATTPAVVTKPTGTFKPAATKPASEIRKPPANIYQTWPLKKGQKNSFVMSLKQGLAGFAQSKGFILKNDNYFDDVLEKVVILKFGTSVVSQPNWQSVIPAKREK